MKLVRFGILISTNVFFLFFELFFHLLNSFRKSINQSLSFFLFIHKFLYCLLFFIFVVVEPILYCEDIFVDGDTVTEEFL